MEELISLCKIRKLYPISRRGIYSVCKKYNIKIIKTGRYSYVKKSEWDKAWEIYEFRIIGYSKSTVAELFEVNKSNEYFSELIKQIIPHKIVNGYSYYKKVDVDDLLANSEKYGLLNVIYAGYKVYYLKDSQEDYYLNNYFTLQMLNDAYKNETGENLYIHTFNEKAKELIGIPRKHVYLFGIKKPIILIENNYFDTVLENFIQSYELNKENSPYRRFEIYSKVNEFTEHRFKRTLGYIQEYVIYSLSKKKNQQKAVTNALDMQKILLFSLEKEIDEYENEEIVNLIQCLEMYSTTKKTLFQFLKYLTEKQYVNFNVAFSVQQNKTEKTINDFYSYTEWEEYVNFIFDIDKHIVKAFDNYTYARYWLYAMLQCNVPWRIEDILDIPEVPVEVEKYDLNWFKNNTFTREEALIVVESAKNFFEQYLVKKTGVKKHFIIMQSFVIGVAIGIIICEQYRRSLGGIGLFNTMSIKYGTLEKLLGPEMKDFKNLKACRSLLSFSNEVATNTSTGNAISVASYMRSHKTDAYNFSDTTTSYLKSSYDERELLSIPAQLNEIGLFGWFYNDILKVLDIEPQNRPKVISNIQKEYSPKQIDGMANYLLNEQKKRDEIIAEVLKLDECELREYIHRISTGQQPGKKDGFQCMKEKCHNPTSDNCEYCSYSIPSVHAIGIIGQITHSLLDKLILEKDMSTELDKRRNTYQLTKLLVVLKEAKETFGENFVCEIANYHGIKEKFMKLKGGD